MLSTGAEAALLKTLEESPEHVVFVLATTDPLKVAPTIRSRTQHYEFTLYTVDELVGHLADVCEQEGVDADREALTVIARAGAGSMRDSLSLLDQAIAHGRIDVEQVNALFGGTAFAGRMRVLRAVADEDVAGALVALGELLDAGHEPRRLTEDLLVTVTRRVPPHVGDVGGCASTCPPTTRQPSSALGEQVGAPMLVRTLETLGQAVVDMRGTDAADPRLVLEIALVRLARREAGTPLQALAERVDRLERGGGARRLPARVGTTPAPPAAPCRRRGQRPRRASGRSFAELRRQRAAEPAVEEVEDPAAPPRARARARGRAAGLRTGGRRRHRRRHRGVGRDPPRAAAGDARRGAGGATPGGGRRRHHVRGAEGALRGRAAALPEGGRQHPRRALARLGPRA